MKTARQSRPTAKKRPHRTLHKKIALHPLTVMVLLCMGVIILGSTYKSLAASYDVTATVQAPLPTAPAIITTPYAEQHVSTPAITVTGNCPVGSYVKLFRNAAFSGAGNCVSSSFSIQTSVAPQANSLQARVFNITDQEGPTSAPVTVYYDHTTLTPQTPSSPPAAIVVDQIETTDYKPGATPEVSPWPTISGFAPPFADIVVTFHSDPVTCKTRANAVGWWSCTLASELPGGVHRVEITAWTPDGKAMKLSDFYIRVGTKPSLLRPATASQPLQIVTDYRYQTHAVGEDFAWNLQIHGGQTPYTVDIDWKDAKTTSYMTAAEPLLVTHAFPKSQTYAPLITARDANGQTALLQLAAAVKGAPQMTGVAATNKLSSLLNTTSRYLWIAWPVYGVLVLMTISFWLGEREMLRHTPTVRPRTIKGR